MSFNNAEFMAGSSKKAETVTRQDEVPAGLKNAVNSQNQQQQHT
jgi:hypothetical protein